MIPAAINASYAFCFPIGSSTNGLLLSAAKIKTSDMVINCCSQPTVQHFIMEFYL